MGNNDFGHELKERISTRAPTWMENYINNAAESSDWANSSQVARDLLEFGIIVTELNKEDISLSETPISNWERPKGVFPNDPLLVCPECVNSNMYLFRYMKESDIEALLCLECGHFDEIPEYVIEIPEDYYWAQSGPHPDWHLVDPDERRTLCERYNDEGLDTSFAPSTDERPNDICEECWHALLESGAESLIPRPENM